MQELVKRIYCDGCITHGERREGAVSRVIVIDGESYMLDVCPEHDAPILALEATLLGYRIEPKTATVVPAKRRGRPPKGAPPMMNACLACGQSLASRDALGKHVRAVHGESLPALERKMGVTYVCPQCAREFPSRGSLGMHVTKGHGAA